MDENEDRHGATGEPIGRASVRGAARSPSIRDARVAEERETSEREAQQDRGISDDDRLEMFRDSLQQSVLPDLPTLPGFHVCWLTTSNPRDTIPWRLRIGYSLVRAEEVPGWDGIIVKGGDYTGIIGVNEMLAAKIPVNLYNRYMQEVHHAMPLAEEGKLRAAVDRMQQELQARGARVDEGDGMASLNERAKPMPGFAY